MHAPAIEPDADIVALEAGLDAAERDARALVEGLAEAAAGWRARPGSWSVAECLDHLATSNEVYLEAMRGGAQPHAKRAGQAGGDRRDSTSSKRTNGAICGRRGAPAGLQSRRSLAGLDDGCKLLRAPCRFTGFPFDQNMSVRRGR